MPLPTASPANDLPRDFVASHSRVIADAALQFSLTPKPKTIPPVWPEWLLQISRWFAAVFKAFGPYAKFSFWAFVTALVVFVLFLILRELGYVNWQRRASPTAPEAEWSQDEAPARKLLADADALAATGQFEQAAHLVLLRAFEDIAARRPALNQPAMTAREMAQAENMPVTARMMFGEIATRVEASLFGGQGLNADGWGACRAAYARFALPTEWL